MRCTEWLLLGGGVTAGILLAAQVERQWVRLIVVLSISALCAGVARWLAVRRFLHWRDISDDEFRRTYAERFSGDPGLALLERRHIAHTLSVPVTKVAVDQALVQLAQSAGRLGSADVGLGDLEAELSEAGRDNRGFDWQGATVGQYIERILRGSGAHRST